MDYIFLTEQFYIKYNQQNYPEIERKRDRPYVMIKINVDGLDFAIPLRSNISHNHVLWTDKKNRCGVDYSKAVIIPDQSYIDSRQPHIRENEHRALKGKEYLLKTGFEKYIKEYKEALNEQHIQRNKILCNYSTLQYYHREIGLVESELSETDTMKHLPEEKE